MIIKQTAGTKDIRKRRAWFPAAAFIACVMTSHAALSDNRDDCSNSPKPPALKACTALIEAGGRAEDMAKSHFNRAFAYERLGQKKRAKADYQLALKHGADAKSAKLIRQWLKNLN